MATTDGLIYGGLHGTLMAALTLACLAVLARRLGKARPGCNIVAVMAAAFTVRLTAAALMSLVASFGALRNIDELGYLPQARELGDESFLSGAMMELLAGKLHLWTFAMQFRIFEDPSEMGLRIVQIGLGVAAIALIVAAVFDLAGARAAGIVSWLLVLEPTSVFFSGQLLKEPVILLAEGLVALGGVRMWRQPDSRAGVLLASGVLIATATRPYAGWFLLVAAVLVTLHAALRSTRYRRHRRFALPAVVGAAVAFVALSFALNVSLQRGLDTVSFYQSATVSDASNLALEPVDFSSPQGLAVNLPRRIRDVLFRPYPWQVGNLSQQLGVLGTGVAWVSLATLLFVGITAGRSLFSRAAPLLYPFVLTTVAYALSTGNAGTGFRYRTHLLMFMIALLGLALSTVTRRSRGDVPLLAGHAPAAS